jgi:hypothetical protein
MKQRWIITTLGVCLASTTATASTWHVATTGSDTNSGTEAAPFRTIQRAADAVAAGDNVVIHAGTYAGFEVTTSGTEAAPITFSGDGSTVAIDGGATANRDAILTSGASWITIEKLAISGATRAGIAAEDGAHITVRDNRIDDNGRWGVFSSHLEDFVVEDNEVSRSGTEHGIYASNSADRPVIRRNVIWGNGMCGVHMNGDINYGGDGTISGALIEANVIYDNGKLGGSGINADGVTNSVIRNNVLDNNHASGISLYRIDGGSVSSGNLVINNTIRMASDARWAINIQDGSTGNTLRNNILLDANTSTGAVTLCSTCTSGFASDHNAVVGRFMVGSTTTDLAGWRTRTSGDAASFVATSAQLFVGGDDLSLVEGSPAIDAGVATGAPETDIDGVARPQGDAVDIGAYEFVVPGSGDGSGDGSGSGSGSGDGSGSGSGDGSGDGSGSGSGSGSDGPDYSGPGLTDGGEGGGGCDVGVGAGWLAAALVFGVRRRRKSVTM